MIQHRKIPSTNGNLAATIHYPVAITEKLVILCSGYLDSKDYLGMLTLACCLSERGYTVVRFDATGIWESDGDIADYTTTQYLADIESVIEYMMLDTKGAYTHTTLLGHGRGGMVSLLYSARDTRISEVVCIMPSSDRSMEFKREDEWETFGFEYVVRDLPTDRTKKREFKVPHSHLIDLKTYNIMSEIQNISAHVYLLAGGFDAVVPPRDVERLYLHIPSSIKKYTVITDIIHDYRLHDNQIKAVNDAVVELLKEK